jgi:hypothetical protein
MCRFSSYFHVIVCLSFPLFSIGNNFTGVKLSCASAASHADNNNQFCTFALWQSATAYYPVNFTRYDAGSPMSLKDQNAYAQYLYGQLIAQAPSASTKMCKDVSKRFACVQAFPECPLVGSSFSSIGYFLPCKLLCQQMNKICLTSISCERFPSKDCDIYLPPNYFALSSDQGPYDPLTAVYAFVLSCWILMTIAWCYTTFFVYADTSVTLCKFVAGVPILKSITVLLGVVFWSTCNSWLMCSYWIGVSFMNIHLIYETIALMVFLLVAKGWSITRLRITIEDWRLVIILICFFYVAMSIILVLENNALNRNGFWIAVGIVYGIMYYFIFANVLKQLRRLSIQVSLLESTMPRPIVGPLLEKYRMYVLLLILIFIALAIEITCHSIIATSGSMWKTMCVYEVSNMLIFLTMGLIFRPREHSPFFFMIPARLDDARTRAIATIEATDNDCDEAEVELAPLILHEGISGHDGSQRRIAAIPQCMIIIRNPDKGVSVGISSQMNRPLIPLTAALANEDGNLDHNNN